MDLAVRENQAFAATIVVHAHNKDRRGATFSLRFQYNLKYIWETIIKETEYFIKIHKFSGTTNVKLLQYTAKHRKFYIDLTEASTHVPVEFPNGHSRVTYLMTLITCKDLDVLSALANICQDEDNKRRNFENTVNFLLLTCPVVKKSNTKNRRVTHAEVATADGLTGAMKSGKGTKTGVDLQYHPKPEHDLLSPP